MSNLSLTACSFFFRKYNTKKSDYIFNLNESITITDTNDNQHKLKNCFDLFNMFFNNYNHMYKDDDKKQTFKCDFKPTNFVETDKFTMYYVKINSGIYGSSSRILDGNTEKLLFNKKEKDIDVRPFYLMIVFPKDHNDLKVQKGIFIFQNNGQYGVKTITTTLMQRYFSTNFDISINCLSIAPSAFIKKVLKKDSVKKMKLVKNFKSVDPSDNLGYGYGSEVRELSKLSFTDSAWSNIQDKMLHFCGSKLTLFEFQNVSYDDLKVVVDVGGKDRTINLHNIENVSIIEDIPEYIQAKDGHPKLELLIEYFKSVALDYMSEMVLRIK